MTIRKILSACVAMVPAERRPGWAALPVLALVTALAEAGAAAAVFGLITLVGDPTQMSRIPIAAWLAARMPDRQPQELIVILALLVVVYHVGKSALVVWTQYLRHRIVGESSAALASAMLRGYLLAPYPFHFRRHSAELIRNTTLNVDAVFVALAAAASILSELLVGAGIIAVLLAASPLVTLIAGVLLVGLTLALLLATRRMAERAGGAVHELSREMLQTLQHALGALKEIKALGREDFFTRAYAEQQRARLQLGYVGVTLDALPPLVFETVFVCGALLVIALLSATGRIGAGGLPLLGLFAYAGFRIVPMANRITWRLNEIRGREAPVRALYRDFRLFTGHAQTDAAHDTPVSFRATLALEGVSYTYPETAGPALRGVTLAIRRGEALAVFGPTGAGKSTLIDLVVGLLPPTSGRVTVDGVDLAGRESAWRRHVGYVPQTIVLLDDSLRRNVALGIPPHEIDPQRLTAALRIAQLDAFVATLPEGLDTRVGERGVRLSGGERQRVGIARALYHDPDVVVLDEATAALDAATETALTDALRALHGRKTVLLISHRLATVRACDRIALISGGTLLDCGTADELQARSAEFRRLANATPAQARSA
ncbi:MAG: ABC transporter ATP-binding protein [Deltaproteobacteria bacterium]|nr:ABC transporter ATP-binding protein [Deltaproteobacteria bacterium]